MTVATPGAVKPTVDQGSLAVDANGGDADSLDDQKASDFDVVFVPGGHGPMEDLAVSKSFGALIVDFLDSHKVVSAVCHAPAALLPATREDGSWAFAGYDVTGFTNEEETQAGLSDNAPWSIASSTPGRTPRRPSRWPTSW